MKTPICDFVRQYDRQRFHMPGHKGIGPLGCERYDITEVAGADSLYTADGIVAESEANASSLFGCPTFYSTEGSSQCIRAMLYLATRNNRRVLAGRNCHTAFLSAAALLDLEVDWLDEDTAITADYAAVYVTSPDYLGNICDIATLAERCHAVGVKLLVDNAHGAYLRFLSPSRHPMDLGADLCCDSAHKTLPVLTGGAYLHTREMDGVKEALALFGSTSPSYLILQSLDAANVFLENFRPTLTVPPLPFDRVGDEPLKITLAPKSRGYTGLELADILRQAKIECEFADPDYLVLMPQAGQDLSQLAQILDLPPRPPITQAPPPPMMGRRVMSIRQAMLAESQTVDITQAEGRVLAQPSVFCPPAIPILVCGEVIDRAAIEAFSYYGIKNVRIVK